MTVLLEIHLLTVKWLSFSCLRYIIICGYNSTAKENGNQFPQRKLFKILLQSLLEKFIPFLRKNAKFLLIFYPTALVKSPLCLNLSTSLKPWNVDFSYLLYNTFFWVYIIKVFNSCYSNIRAFWSSNCTKNPIIVY